MSASAAGTGARARGGVAAAIVGAGKAGAGGIAGLSASAASAATTLGLRAGSGGGCGNGRAAGFTYDLTLDARSVGAAGLVFACAAGQLPVVAGFRADANGNPQRPEASGAICLGDKLLSVGQHAVEDAVLADEGLLERELAAAPRPLVLSFWCDDAVPEPLSGGAGGSAAAAAVPPPPPPLAAASAAALHRPVVRIDVLDASVERLVVTLTNDCNGVDQPLLLLDAAATLRLAGRCIRPVGCPPP